MKNWIRFIILPALSMIVLSCATSSTDSDPTSNLTPLPSATFQQQTTQTSFITLTSDIESFSPAQDGTPIPALHKEITIENVSQMVKLARWGNGFPREAVYSPDGRFIALSTSIGVRIYRADTLELIQFIETQSDIGSIAISPNGTILAAGGRELLLVYNINDGTLVRSLEKEIKDIDFSPDGRFLAVGIGDWNLCRGGRVELWNVSDWTLKQELANGLECVGEVLFSPSGKYLAASSYDVLVWEFNKTNIALKRQDAGCAGQEDALAFTRDEKFLLTGSSNNSGRGIVCLDRVSDGEHLGILKRGNPSSLYSFPQISLLPNSDLLAIIQDKTLTLWEPNEWKIVQTIENVSNTTWSPDREDILSVSNDGLEIWSIGGEKVINSKENFSKPINAMAWFPDTDYLAIATSFNQEEGQITLKHIQGDTPDNYIDFFEPVFSFVFPSSGKKLGFGFDEKGAQIWDLDNNKLLQIFDGMVGYGRRSIEFSEDGSIIALNIKTRPYEADTQGLEIWTTNDWRNKFSWKVKEEGVILTDVDISHDNKFVAASFYSGKVRLWNMETGLLEATLIFPDTSELMMGISFSPNGRFVASASLSGKLGVWSTDTHQLLYTFETRGTWQQRTSGDSIAWSPNGQILAIGARNGVIFLINTSDGKLIHTLKSQTKSISSLLFSPDGKMLASVSEDGTICLWGFAP